MTYAELTNAKSAHETAAQILRFAGFNAKCFKNQEMPHQPYEIKIKGITAQESGELQDQMAELVNYQMLNIIAA